MINKELFLQIWVFKISLHVGGSYILHRISLSLSMDGPKIRNWKRRIRAKKQVVQMQSKDFLKKYYH